MRKLLENKLCSRNLIKGMNTWWVPLVKYTGPFLKWTKEELRQRNKRISISTKHYIQEMTDCVSRKRESGLTSIKKSKERLIISASISKSRTNRKITKARKLAWLLIRRPGHGFKKKKPQGRNWISSNNSTKWHHKDQLY